MGSNAVMGENDNTAVFLPMGCNPYGYRLNINHKRINELYRRYKAWKGLATNMPITDNQRREFEGYVLRMLGGENISPR